jgi:hypothetical protein
MGHEACVIALNDRACESELVEERNVLRLPASLPWDQRIARAADWLESFAPDWISLQFVAYGFQRKGLVYGLGDRLAPLFTGRRVHMMFHELWIGHARRSPLKDRFIGALQHRLILKLVQQLRPTLVHVNCSPYLAALRQSGITASRLPLFSNIPVLDHADNRWVFDAVRAETSFKPGAKRGQWLLFGFFGAIRPQWSWPALFPQIEKAARQAGKQVAILSAGKLGNAGEESWKQMALEWGSRFSMVRLGPQPSERVSEYLSALDFSLLTSPRILVGKSGVVAAMLDHALPVIVSRDDVSYPYDYDAEELRHSLIMSPEATLSDQLGRALSETREWSLPRVAKCFCECLQNVCVGNLA